MGLSWSPFQAPAGTTFNVYRSTQLPVPRDAAHRIANGLTSGGCLDSTGQLGNYYVVTAQNSAGQSAPSNTAVATTGGGSMATDGGEAQPWLQKRLQETVERAKVFLCRAQRAATGVSTFLAREYLGYGAAAQVAL